MSNNGAPPKVDKSGWLHKQGEQRKSWKKRFMKLSGQTMYYYPGPKVSSPPLFLIYYQNICKISETSPLSSLYLLCIFIHSPAFCSPHSCSLRDSFSRMLLPKARSRWSATTFDHAANFKKIFVSKYHTRLKEHITCTPSHKRSKNHGSHIC